MLALKKNLFSIGVAFSIILGVAFSFGFAPQDTLMSVDIDREGNSCYTSATNSMDFRSLFCTGSGGSCAWEYGKGSNSAKCPN